MIPALARALLHHLCLTAEAALHRDFSVCGHEHATEVVVRQRCGAHIHASKHELKLKLAYKAKVRSNKQKNNLSIMVSASVF